MRVSREGRAAPVFSLSTITGGADTGPSGHSLQSLGSNGGVAWSSNIASIAANASNYLIGPHANFAAGTGITLSTASNTMTIAASGGGAPGSSAFVGCRVRKSTAFSHNSSGNLLAVTFDTEDFDTSAFHDAVTNTSRVTIPTGLGGKYRITINGEWDTNTTNDRGFQIWLNGTTEIGWVRLKPTNTGVAYGVTTIYALSAGDYVEFRAYQDSGGTRTLTARANTSPSLELEFLGT